MSYNLYTLLHFTNPTKTENNTTDDNITEDNTTKTTPQRQHHRKQYHRKQYHKDVGTNITKQKNCADTTMIVVIRTTIHVLYRYLVFNRLSIKSSSSLSRPSINSCPIIIVSSSSTTYSSATCSAASFSRT